MIPRAPNALPCERGWSNEMPANETVSRSRLYSGQVIPRFFGPDPQAVKTIVQRESRHWIHSMNGRVRPFALIAAFSSGVTHKINHGF